MSPYLLHLRHSVFLFVAPALTVAGAAVAWNAMYPTVASPANIANVVVSTSAVVAPVLAGFAAWDGLRERRHGGAPILGVAVQPGARIEMTHIVVGLTYAAAMQLAIIGIVHVRGVLYSLAGPPSWVNLGIALLISCLATTGGYLAAGVLRNWAAVIVAALLPMLVYGYSLLGPGIGYIATLIPFGNRAGTDFLDPNPFFFLGQSLFLAGLLGILVGATAVFSARDRRWGVIVALGAVLVATSGAVGVGLQGGRWGLPVENPSARLVQMKTADGALTLSVLPTYRPVGDDLLARWSRVQHLLVATPAAFITLEQLSDSHPAPSNRVGALRVIYLNPGSPSIATHSVLESLVDLHAPSCEQRRTFETALVEMWLAGEGSEVHAQLMPEHAEALASLRELSDEDAQAWMTEHFDDFVRCSVSSSDLPMS